METSHAIFSHLDQPDLGRVVVRPILSEERKLWNELMRQHHYLGFGGFIGRSLRYVAEREGRWLALLGWQSAALKCKVRDRWIGWPPFLKYQRLEMIANNSRFLILPHTHERNLASRVLSLNLKRLSDDWEAVHGWPLLLVETFVDPEFFTGACYRAANWQLIGKSRGFGKNHKGYEWHDRPKLVLVYPLHRRARSLLADPKWQPRRVKMNPKALSTKQMEDLHQLLRSLPDCRHPRGIRHRYWTVLTIAIAGVLCGAKSFIALSEFANSLTQKQLKRLACRYNPKKGRYEAPTESTIRRVLQASDAELIDRMLGKWLMAASNSQNAVAVDGKTLRGARRPDGSQVHLLSAFLHQQGVSIAQVEVAEKTNEIPELQRMLEPMNIEDRVVTADAMHTQKETARYIVEEKKADYVFTVKDNQATLLEDIKALNESDFSQTYQTVDKGHGRLETRRIQVTELLNNYLDFPHCNQVFRIERERNILKSGEVEKEVVYGITSLKPEKADPARLLQLNRGQWEIENRLHYVRDTAYDEDRQQIRTKKGPRIMATLRNFAISFLRLIGWKNIVSALRTYVRSTRKVLNLLKL